ncbi:MAG TPA: beta-L-arabinofuranosidase domain-containing protein [Treponemataceae bacterium]|nr:beta-L-arabinofuranosidase domain-containing protein [Treponemataceae bacterium]
MIELKGKNVTIKDNELMRREKSNREYLMKLTNDNLLMNYALEAGRFASRGIPADSHTGWESPVCQLRGHFLGHWLSAAAMHYEKSGDRELIAKAEVIIEELAECQKDNGGQWVGPIPEKYLYWIAKGKSVWAPQYTLHKILMGLVDMFLYGGSQKGLEVADSFADWFVEWSGKYSRAEFDDILDVETGGMLEVWAELLKVTGKEKYKLLLERYYRSRLFQPLLEGKDPLTNMHANTTIPEVLGCARAYEVTGERRWMDIVTAYWNCAVTQRGSLVTGGQTSGEIWMPKGKMKNRFGDKNQEHCTVYNMMRLAEFLFRHTKDPVYLQYMEYNLYNGIMAQTYYQEYSLTGSNQDKKKIGLLTYFLPMKAGLHKDWRGETDSFFCCHGTMVQANAAFNRSIYYQENTDLYICQYFNSEMKTAMDGVEVKITQTQDTMSGSLMNSSNTAGSHAVNEITVLHENIPHYKKYDFVVQVLSPNKFTIQLRIPDWITSEAVIYVNGKIHGKSTDSSIFYKLGREWKDGDSISILLPLGIRFTVLPEDETMGAFRYGPEVLAGICESERILYLENEDVASEIIMENEREWGSWRYFFKTVNQNPSIQFRRIRDIGYEPFQTYFKIKQSLSR